MNCPNCNSPLGNDAQFCPHCGQRVANQQVAPQMQPNVMPQHPMRPGMPPVAPRQNNNMIVIIIAVAAVVICGLLAGIFILKSDKDGDDKEKTEQAEGADNAALDESQYDWLSEREVTAADLSGKSPGDLRLMRNAMFAKHGYKFKSKDLQEYFANFSWYTPRYNDVNHLLNAVEKKNIATIQKFEGGGATAGGGSKSTGSLRNVGFTDDYSDIVCYTWLTDSDVAGLSSSQLRILRNTIYARHGRKFKSADLRNYFSGFSWYTPLYDEISPNSLSDTERHNITLIQKYE